MGVAEKRSMGNAAKAPIQAPFKMATGKSARPVKGSESSATRRARNAGEQGGSLQENENERFDQGERRHYGSTSSRTQML
jgi:hypothetical protein